jgi:hypothetical protein
MNHKEARKQALKKASQPIPKIEELNRKLRAALLINELIEHFDKEQQKNYLTSKIKISQQIQTIEQQLKAESGG